jgi:pimeloyl-ACP methyl ester carboxylesterase
MIKSFRSQKIQTTGATINVVSGGQGPPLLLLHGNPETHVMWYKIASRLATEFSVFAADLRGYGDSSKPEGGENHSNYSKRAMALDQIELMSHSGFEKFAVVGHDRGGRVGHRMALDHPDRVTKLAVRCHPQRGWADRPCSTSKGDIRQRCQCCRIGHNRTRENGEGFFGQFCRSGCTESVIRAFPK